MLLLGSLNNALRTYLAKICILSVSQRQSEVNRNRLLATLYSLLATLMEGSVL